MKQRQSFTGNRLPGKASNAFAKAKAGIREVNGYASWNGLSSSDDKQLRQGSVADAQESVVRNAIREDSEFPIVQGLARLDYNLAMKRTDGNFDKAMKRAGLGLSETERKERKSKGGKP